MTVFSLKKGQKGRVEKISVPTAVKNRLISIGVRRGAVIKVLAFSLFNSSILLSCNGIRFGLRREYALSIEVSIC